MFSLSHPHNRQKPSPLFTFSDETSQNKWKLISQTKARWACNFVDLLLLVEQCWVSYLCPQINWATCPWMEWTPCPRTEWALCQRTDWSSCPQINWATSPWMEWASCPRMDWASCPQIDLASCPRMDRVSFQSMECPQSLLLPYFVAPHCKMCPKDLLSLLGWLTRWLQHYYG